jgi:hypothetical protein
VGVVCETEPDKVGWYGFALDGTLAKYDGWRGISVIGEPVAPIVSILKSLVKAGLKVKIVTDRVDPCKGAERLPNPYTVNHLCIQSPSDMPWALENAWTAREFVAEWCWRNLGFVPEITHKRDGLMLNLFDSNVTQVEPNTGRILGRLPIELNVYGARRGKYVDKKCERCGNVEKMYSSARFCSACRAIRMKEANREAYIRKAMAG